MKVNPPIAGWAELLRSIGATPADWFSSTSSGDPATAWKVELKTIGIDVELDDIEVDFGTGLYLYKGQQILIYIKDTRQASDTLLNDRDNSKRFHFKDCAKIQEMKQANRFQRYVAIARTDGRFPAVATEEDGSKRELEAPLGPCKICLRELNFRGYQDAKHGAKKEIWDEFDIPDFFRAYASQISNVPPTACPGIHENEYGPDWPAVSLRIRQAARWRCAECHVDLAGARRCLHVHHINGTKNDASPENLRPLCVLCHAAQPGHGSMHVGRRCLETIEARRNEITH